MSDILIRGMEMPENCAVLVNGHLYRCPLYDADGYCAKTGREALKSGNGVKRGKPDWCPLVELPEHGRLIDADKITHSVKSQTDIVRAWGIDELTEIADLMGKGLLQEIENATTIIPASGGET